MARQRYKNPFGPAEVLEEQDIRALLDGCSRRAPTGVRNRALILTLWRAGLRIDEALTLGPQDVKLEDHEPVIRVRRAKGDKQRTVGLHAEAQDALRRWLEVRRACGCDERRPARAPRRLFCTLDGAQLDQVLNPTPWRFHRSPLRRPVAQARALLPNWLGRVWSTSSASSRALIAKQRRSSVSSVSYSGCCSRPTTSRNTGALRYPSEWRCWSHQRCRSLWRCGQVGRGSCRAPYSQYA
ncbi:MAG: tyrosine-type recombinase/integrase [Solirubrobacteraceae bacterium]